MKRFFAIAILLAAATIFITGCGETFNGVAKDTRRIGKGVKTVFIREE